MTVVYRIQDSTGRGPYKPGWSHHWQEERCLIDGSKHPPIMEEFPGIVNRMTIRFDVAGGHFGCGFRTMEQLNNWFTNAEINKLKNYGYEIVEIHADEILAESDKQLVFWCKRPLRRIAVIHRGLLGGVAGESERFTHPRNRIWGV